jgi:hypothetical protein
VIGVKSIIPPPAHQPETLIPSLKAESECIINVVKGITYNRYQKQDSEMGMKLRNLLALTPFGWK